MNYEQKYLPLDYIGITYLWNSIRSNSIRHHFPKQRENVIVQ